MTEYGLCPDWPALLRVAPHEGLSAVVDAIREHETTLSAADTDNGSTHFKTSDDAAALLAEF